MNLPLNIDWQQILLHLFNFGILALGLYLLLYKPVKNFMDKRTAYYEALDAKANAALRDAEALKLDYQSQLSTAGEEANKLRQQASKDAESKASAKIEEANSKAERIISEARAEAEIEKEKIVASAKQDILDLAAEAAEKIINKSLESEGLAHEQ